jgi:hypothetical protein
MTDFDTDERSASGSRPIDLYIITTPTFTYHLTSHIVDVRYGGNVYTAITMSRGNQQVAQDLTGRELVVYLPISHPLVQRYAAFGVPEREVVVTQLRLQETSGIAEQAHTGYGQSLSLDAHVAALRVPSVTDDAMKIRLPVIVAQRLCNHRLYDSLCGVARTSFQVNTAMISQSGVVLVVGTMNGNPDGWASPNGEILHVASTERRKILQQSGNTLELNVPFVNVRVGDAVIINASCNNNTVDCKFKFNNTINYGGLPLMNTTLGQYGTGFGIITQE